MIGIRKGIEFWQFFDEGTDTVYTLREIDGRYFLRVDDNLGHIETELEQYKYWLLTGLFKIACKEEAKQ